MVSSSPFSVKTFPEIGEHNWFHIIPFGSHGPKSPSLGPFDNRVRNPSEMWQSRGVFSVFVVVWVLHGGFVISIENVGAKWKRRLHAPQVLPFARALHIMPFCRVHWWLSGWCELPVWCGLHSLIVAFHSKNHHTPTATAQCDKLVFEMHVADKRKPET